MISPQHPLILSLFWYLYHDRSIKRAIHSHYFWAHHLTPKMLLLIYDILYPRFEATVSLAQKKLILKTNQFFTWIQLNFRMLCGSVVRWSSCDYIWKLLFLVGDFSIKLTRLQKKEKHELFDASLSSCHALVGYK